MKTFNKKIFGIGIWLFRHKKNFVFRVSFRGVTLIKIGRQKNEYL
jgi:hypothetical protein